MKKKDLLKGLQGMEKEAKRHKNTEAVKFFKSMKDQIKFLDVELHKFPLLLICSNEAYNEMEDFMSYFSGFKFNEKPRILEILGTIKLIRVSDCMFLV